MNSTTVFDSCMYRFSAPTEHDMEAYRLTMSHSSDPMASYINSKPK